MDVCDRHFGHEDGDRQIWEEVDDGRGRLTCGGWIRLAQVRCTFRCTVDEKVEANLEIRCGQNKMPPTSI